MMTIKSRRIGIRNLKRGAKRDFPGYHLSAFGRIAGDKVMNDEGIPAPWWWPIWQSYWMRRAADELARPAGLEPT